MRKITKKYHLLIGIPAYNEEANIKFLLDSLVTQSQNNFVIDGILVYSDGSTDQTETIVANYKSRLVTLISDGKRMGQNYRQNQMVEEFFKMGSDCLAILEADTLPTNKDYFNNLISKIPSDGNYSLISSDSTPVSDVNLLGRILNFGFYMRHDIFEKAVEWPNLYLRSNGLFSKKFLRTFRWAENFHEDSYCYRRAVESKMPILRSPESIVYFRSVQNLHDYFLQSVKFRQAAEKESGHSNIYKLDINYPRCFEIVISYLISNPFLFVSYLLLVSASKIKSLFAQKYSPFWSIYTSSKGIINT